MKQDVELCVYAQLVVYAYSEARRLTLLRDKSTVAFYTVGHLTASHTHRPNWRN